MAENISSRSGPSVTLDLRKKGTTILAIYVKSLSQGLCLAPNLKFSKGIIIVTAKKNGKFEVWIDTDQVMKLEIKEVF